MIPREWLEEAVVRVGPHIQNTPLTFDPDQNLYLKWENRQRTGSFKLRGALNKVLSLQPWELEKGLVAASAGNHGQGVAQAAGLTGAYGVVFASQHAVPSKLEAMRALGVEVRLVEGGYAEAERAGIAYAREHEAVWISPYNDGQVIAGQGTLGMEITRQLTPTSDQTWFVPAGGGGLLAGIAAALEYSGPPRPGLVGVQSEASPFMHALYYGQTQATVRELPSLADGLAGEVEEGSLTIPIVKRWVDDFMLVSEDEIAQAVVYAWKKYGEKIEGSGAVSLAAALFHRRGGGTQVVIISGGNIQPEVHAHLIETGSATLAGLEES